MANMPLYLYLILTIVIEVPLVVLYFKSQWKLALLVGILLNVFTWPLLHLLMFETRLPIPLLEFGVAVVEGIGYSVFFKNKLWKVLLLSFLVNGISYGVGLLI